MKDKYLHEVSSGFHRYLEFISETANIYSYQAIWYHMLYSGIGRHVALR